MQKTQACKTSKIDAYPLIEEGDVTPSQNHYGDVLQPESLRMFVF